MRSPSVAIALALGFFARILLASGAAVPAAEDVSASPGEVQTAQCTPATVGQLSFKNSNFYRNIAMRGSIVYAATSANVNPFNFRAIDISDRSAPVLRGASVLLGELGPAPPIEFSSNHAYVTTSFGLSAVDISNPMQPGAVTEFEVPGLTPDSARVSGSRAYVIGKERNNNRYRMSVVDISVPIVPVQLGFFAVDGSGDYDFNWRDVEVLGNVVYVGAPALLGSGGAIRAIDVTNPAAPREVGRFTDPNIYSVRLATYGTQLLALGSHYLLVIDVSNPAAPRLVVKVDTGGSQSEDLSVAGDRAFVADVVADKVFIFDLSKLPQLTQAGSVTLDAYRLAADERTAAVVLFNDEILNLVDVSSCFGTPKRRRAVRF